MYADVLDGLVFCWDHSGVEADLVIELADGRWGAIEVKMDSKEIEVAVSNLLKLRNKVDVQKMGIPAFLMVVTGGEYAYARDDGVHAARLRLCGTEEGWTRCGTKGNCAVYTP